MSTSKRDEKKRKHENAKNSQKKILSRVFPEIMSFSEAQKITGTSLTNISNAAKGNSLLNAKALAKILKVGFNFKHTAEISSLLRNEDADLENYLCEKLGREYTDVNYSKSEYTENLLSAVDDEDAQLFYSILYSKEKVSTNVIVELFGKRKATFLIELFVENDIIFYHKPLKLVQFNKNATSTNLTFVKRQMSLIVQSLNTKGLTDKDQYQYDTDLLTQNSAIEAYNEIKRHRNKMSDIFTNDLKNCINQRYINVSYAVCSTFNNIKNELEEVKQ